MLSYLKLSKFFLYLTVFSLLVITSSTLFPFITGKYIFFRLAVELSLIFFLLAWGFQPGLNLKPRLVKAFNQPLVIIISLFVSLLFSSSLISFAFILFVLLSSSLRLSSLTSSFLSSISLTSFTSFISSTLLKFSFSILVSLIGSMVEGLRFKFLLLLSFFSIIKIVM